MFRMICSQFYDLSDRFAKAWFLVDIGHTLDHLVDASMRTIKYLNGPDNS
jgi:hypothetical protein